MGHHVTGEGPKYNTKAEEGRILLFSVLELEHLALQPLDIRAPGLYLFLKFFDNSFIELELTKHPTHSFKVYEPVVFSIFTALCKHHHDQF